MPAQSPSTATQPAVIAKSGCPGVFSPTIAQDGVLSRIRVPGGLLSAMQCRVLADLSRSLGSSSIDITNRANVQIRGLQQALSPDGLAQLQGAQLASPLAQTDHLRNIMASPTAGIDPAQCMDTRVLVRALDRYLCTQPSLTALSPKFSIGIDGGEQVSIAQQVNDICISALPTDSDLQLAIWLRGSHLVGRINTADCERFIAVLTQAYQQFAESMPQSRSKPRLKSVIESVGSEVFWARLQTHCPVTVLPESAAFGTQPVLEHPVLHLGVHPQRQPDLFYVGAVLPLGRLTIQQLEHLAVLSETYGSASIRLTPWRSILIPDLPNTALETVEQALNNWGLETAPTSLWGGLIACSGSTGCTSSATDTQADAVALVKLFSESLALDQPLTIHFTGCSKSCAHHGTSDFTLVGSLGETASLSTLEDKPNPTYSLYVGDRESSFGQLLASNVDPSEVPQRLLQILQIYRQNRTTPRQSFRSFVNQGSIVQLQQWFGTGEIRSNA